MQFWDSIVRAEHSIHAHTGYLALMQEKIHNFLVLFQRITLRYPQIKVCIPHCAAIALKAHERIIQVVADLIESLCIQGASIVVASAQ